MDDDRPTQPQGSTLTEVYSALARVVLVDRELDDVLNEISRIALDAIPGAEATSITLMRGDKAWTAAYTGEIAMQADEIQYATGHGPCMDAGRTGLMLLSNDLASETRWPDYAPRVVKELGVRSSLSAPLPFQGATIGGLNTYSTKPGSYRPESQVAAEAVAAHIAVAVMNADAHAVASSRPTTSRSPWSHARSSTWRWASSWPPTGARRTRRSPSCPAPRRTGTRSCATWRPSWSSRRCGATADVADARAAPACSAG